ncbi:hypothetical protein OROHE_021886 [Orobanche hederae]
MATSRALLLPFSFLRFDFSLASDGSNEHTDFKLSRKEESREEQEKVVGQPELQSLGEEEVVEEVMHVSSIHNTNSLLQDPTNWKNIDQEMRDYLVERGPHKVDGIIYPGNNKGLHFDSSQYIMILPKGQKDNRRLLVYSVSLYCVFRFCCKLFVTEHTLNKIGVLAIEGLNDWKNRRSRLKSHEGSKEHIHCMTSWKELEDRLRKGKTIDCVQLKINKDNRLCP